MKRRLFLFLLTAALLFLFVGCEKEPNAFEINSGRMVGKWQVTAYTLKGVEQDLAGCQVQFTYLADGTGKKTVDGEPECDLTYTYDGEHLYTTAAYPNGAVLVKNDLCSATADTLTVYSYDEDSTMVLTRIP